VFNDYCYLAGVYVMTHPSLPHQHSQFLPENSDMTFDLDLVWGQNTFDGPQQLWRATSKYSVKVRA